MRHDSHKFGKNCGRAHVCKVSLTWFHSKKPLSTCSSLVALTEGRFSLLFAQPRYETVFCYKLLHLQSHAKLSPISSFKTRITPLSRIYEIIVRYLAFHRPCKPATPTSTLVIRYQLHILVNSLRTLAIEPLATRRLYTNKLCCLLLFNILHTVHCKSVTFGLLLS